MPYPIAPEDKRAYRIIPDEEASEAGLPVALTEDDKLREENERLKRMLAAQGVVEQGIRSMPPIFSETMREAPPPQVPWDQLSARTRAELEAGRAALGGGLSAKQAYERSLNLERPPTPMLVAPPAMLAPPPPLSAKTQQEMQNGRDVLSVVWNDRQATLLAIAMKNAERLASGARPTGEEMYYTPDQPPGT